MQTSTLYLSCWQIYIVAWSSVGSLYLVHTLLLISKSTQVPLTTSMTSLYTQNTLIPISLMHCLWYGDRSLTHAGSLDVSIDICLYWSVPNIVIDPDYLRFEWRLTLDQGIIKLISSRFWNLYWYSFRLVQIYVSISIFNIILC